jgi:fluoride exporter
LTLPAPDRAVHLRPSMLAVVAVGGTVGTAVREAIALAVPAVGDVRVAILAINVVGAFVLGVLLEALVRRGADVGRRRLLRLGLGTGFCGGFTTYSALAVGAAELLRDGATAAGAAYAAGSVLLGAMAAWAGVAVGTAIGRDR